MTEHIWEIDKVECCLCENSI